MFETSYDLIRSFNNFRSQWVIFVENLYEFKVIFLSKNLVYLMGYSNVVRLSFDKFHNMQYYNFKLKMYSGLNYFICYNTLEKVFFEKKKKFNYYSLFTIVKFYDNYII